MLEEHEKSIGKIKEEVMVSSQEIRERQQVKLAEKLKARPKRDKKVKPIDRRLLPYNYNFEKPIGEIREKSMERLKKEVEVKHSEGMKFSTDTGVPKNFNSFRHVIGKATTRDDVQWTLHLRNLELKQGVPV
jgi:hypothetical protein